jgi:hypothetical protein
MSVSRRFVVRRESTARHETGGAELNGRVLDSYCARRFFSFLSSLFILPGIFASAGLAVEAGELDLRKLMAESSHLLH